MTRPLLALLLLLPTLDALARPPMPPEILAGDRLRRLRSEYVDGLFRAKPHLATFMGDHRFDDLLPDYGDEARKRREAELLTQLGDLRAIDLRALPVDERIDAAILADGVALELLYLREIREFAWNPRIHDTFPFYDPRDILGNRLSDIIHGEYAPAESRRRAALAQVEALPGFLATWRKNLAAPSKVHLEQAIKENKGRIEFFRTEVRDFLKGDAAVEKVIQQAISSLEAWQTFLEKDLPPRATRDWKLGPDLYARKFPLALQTDLTPAALLARAQADFKESRADLFLLALRLHRGIWPRDKLPASVTASLVKQISAAGDPQKLAALRPLVAKIDAATQARIIARVKDELAKDHPKAAELVQAHAGNLDRLRAFIEKHNLVELPPADTLKVEPMPGFKRGATAAEYLAPGLLDKATRWQATYYVDPVDPTWPADKVESYLRASNNYDVELTASHEAYPGHHTQTYHARKVDNPLRATLWNGPMVEGWAVFGEEQLCALGYGGAKADRYRFIEAQGRMVVAANTILDIELQSGRMTDAEAVRFMVADGFQETARAERKLWRAKLDSTQLVQYHLGFAEIKDLERDYKAKVGKAFKLRDLNDGLVGHGSIAVKHLRTYLMGK